MISVQNPVQNPSEKRKAPPGRMYSGEVPGQAATAPRCPKADSRRTLFVLRYRTQQTGDDLRYALARPLTDGRLCRGARRSEGTFCVNGRLPRQRCTAAMASRRSHPIPSTKRPEALQRQDDAEKHHQDDDRPGQRVCVGSGVRVAEE